MLDRIRSWLNRAGLLEAAVLTTLLIIAGSLWIFIEVADEVMEGGSQKFDDAVLASLRQPGNPEEAIGPPWLRHVARDLTALGGTSVITFVCIISVGFLALLRKWGAMALVLVAIIGGAIMSTVLKINFARPRPSLLPHLTEVSSMSFPSGHSMLAAVTYLTLGSLLARTTRDRRVRAYVMTVSVVLVALIGITRVYLGVHFPTDVVAGWCAGISWALLCSLVARWLQRRGEVRM